MPRTMPTLAEPDQRERMVAGLLDIVPVVGVHAKLAR